MYPQGLKFIQMQITNNVQIKAPFRPLERSWSINIKNGFAFWSFEVEVIYMDKRKVESQTNNLIFDHKNLKNRGSNNFWIKHVVWCWKVYSRATSSLLKKSSIKICMWELRTHKITRFITWQNQEFSREFWNMLLFWYNLATSHKMCNWLV
jgi:hypothetical protein